jgi:hypothetical protein
MRFTAIVGFTFALFTISVNAAPMNNDATEVDINAIPVQYIVVFKDDVNIDSVKEHETWVSGVVLQSEKHKRGLDVSAYGVRRSFNINQFNAYSAKFTDDMLKEIEGSPQVSIECVSHVQRLLENMLYHYIVYGIWQASCDIFAHPIILSDKHFITNNIPSSETPRTNRVY